MDGNCGVICRLQCEISLVSVTGLGCSGDAGEIFLRCHVPAGGGRAIQIDSRAAEPPPGDGRQTATVASGSGVVSWRDVASLSCDGSAACVRELVDRRSVVLEVRGRVETRAEPLGGGPASGRRGVRAGVPRRGPVEGRRRRWVFDRRVALAVRGGSRRPALGEATPVLMTVSMSLRVPETAAPTVRRRLDSAAAHREGGCEWNVGEEDVLGPVACAADDAFE